MTPTPDKTRSVGETDVSARPVSEERLAELIGDVGAVADLVDGHWREVHSALRELQSLRAEVERLRAQLPDGMENCRIRLETCAVCGRHWLQPANWVNHGCPHCERDALHARIASLEKDAAGFLPVARFLLGEDALKGFWFGERPAGKPQFWWREHLRAAIDAAMKEGG